MPNDSEGSELSTEVRVKSVCAWFRTVIYKRQSIDLILVGGVRCVSFEILFLVQSYCETPSDGKIAQIAPIIYRAALRPTRAKIRPTSIIGFEFAHTGYSYVPSQSRWY